MFVGVSSPSLPTCPQCYKEVQEDLAKLLKSIKKRSSELVKLLLQSTVNISVSQYERGMFHMENRHSVRRLSIQYIKLQCHKFLGILVEEEKPANVLTGFEGNEKYGGGVEALLGCLC